MPRFAMVIDLDRCTGCRACMEACKVENNTPQAHFWMYTFRFEEGRYPDTQIWYLPRPCMHCDNAPCVKVCPVGARYKRADGLVATDWDRCIGCRYCEVACPYGVNYFNWKEPSRNQYFEWNGDGLPYRNPDLDARHGDEQRLIAGGGRLKGVIEKCTFCPQRVEKGALPACSASCPTDAILFGDLDDPDSVVSRALVKKPNWRLLEEAGTEPRVHYMGAKPPAPGIKQFDLPRRRVEQ